MSNEHKERAREIVTAHSKHSVVVRQEQLVEAIQVALSSHDAEIREVLEGLAIRRHIDHKSWCWCEKRWDGLKPHEPRCVAARELYERVKL